MDFLYKLATQRSMKPPEFKQVTEQGPAHMKTFVWHCSFNAVVAQGTGRSKKEAKIAAAKAIRDNLDYDALPPPPNHLKRKNPPGPNNGVNGSKKRHPGPGFAHPPAFGSFNPFNNGFHGGYGMTPAFMGPHGPQPVDPKSAEPVNSEKKDEEVKDDAEAYGPSREEFMNPSFGGFFNDTAAVPFDGSVQLPFDRERNLMVAEYQSRIARGYRSRLSKLDRHVIRKHKEIYPDENELCNILNLVTLTEDNLKEVAEALNTTEVKKISGMVRVGDLSKGLLLASDRSVDLVLLCKDTPTKTLLSEITSTLKSKLKDATETELEVSEQTWGLNVVSNDLQVNVSLTSTSMTSVEAEETNDCHLPVDRCLQALTELRHAKWFAVTAANLPSCVECIRIVKDLCLRDEAWRPMSSWAVELLVERALFSAWMPLNPAASLMRVMEVSKRQQFETVV